MATVHGELLAGRWRLGDRLGRGAVADVYLAVDDRTAERVAVKILRHAESDQLARFEREVQALEALEHPGIVSVRGHGELDGRPYLVLDCVDGGSLADLLAARGPLPPERAAAIGAAVADALDHAHRRGIVHRDVKPSNVLIGADGRPLLADFGVAQLDGSETLTASGFTVGTAAYLAPEQVRGATVGPPADVYALGLLVLEAVTGERAFPGSGLTAAMARLDHQPEVPPTVPAPLANRVRAMTAMEATERPSAEAVAGDLALLAEGGGTSVLPVVGDPTEVLAVGGAGQPPRVVVPAPVAISEPESVEPESVEPEPVEPASWRRRALLAAACFAAGFLFVLAVRSLAGGDGTRVPLPSSTTVATTVPSTTAPPPTTAAPADEADEADENDENDEERGNGRGGGHGNDRDD